MGDKGRTIGSLDLQESVRGSASNHNVSHMIATEFLFD